MEVNRYQYIKTKVEELGWNQKLERRARELQYQFQEGEEMVPWEDAYEMAYEDFLSKD